MSELLHLVMSRAGKPINFLGPNGAFGFVVTVAHVLLELDATKRSRFGMYRNLVVRTLLAAHMTSPCIDQGTSLSKKIRRV